MKKYFRCRVKSKTVICLVLLLRGIEAASQMHVHENGSSEVLKDIGAQPLLAQALRLQKALSF